MREGIESEGRLLSLDALRGFDMLMIMGIEGVVMSLCVACGWGTDCWLAQQFQHVEWNGLRFEDTIFPLFLFLAGVSWPFSCARQMEKVRARGEIALKCVRRAAILFVLGLVCGGLLRGQVRMGSVLGRIGIAWMFAAFLHLWLRRTWALAALAVALPVAYWLLLAFVPAPDALTLVVPEKFAFIREFGTGPFSIVGNLSGWMDRTFRPGVLISYTGIADNQSMLGYIPATGTALLGILTGEFVRRTRATLASGRRIVLLLAAAAVLVVLGLTVAHGFGALSMPINKKLWSASFTFVVGGYSVAMFALFHWIVDVRGYVRWTFFFRVIGMNSITIFMAQRFIPFGAIAKNVLGGAAGALPEAWGSVVLSVGTLLVGWLFLYFLYRKNVFLKV